MLRYSTKNKNMRKKRYVIGALIVATVLLSGYLVLHFNNRQTSESIKYTPPTRQELNETKNAKEEIIRSYESSQNPSPQASNTSRQKVTPVITSWGQESDTKTVVVASYVSGISEQNGVCSVVMKSGTQTVSQEQNATFSGQGMSCGFIEVPRSKLNSGTWSIQVIYNSSTYEGTSNQEVSVEVI